MEIVPGGDDVEAYQRSKRAAVTLSEEEGPKRPTMTYNFKMLRRILNPKMKT